MQFRKFRAGSSRSALKRVRDALGNDAMVLKTRVLPGGSVGIWVTAQRDFEDATSPDAPDSARRSLLSSTESRHGLPTRSRGLAGW